jgi:two-component system LytT family response regulator
MTALLVDDERLARVRLRKLLVPHPQIEVVAEADSLDAAEAAIDRHRPQVIFLDIALPGESGFELFQRRRVEAATVFVTAFDEHAVHAFEVNAVDYLLKPVEPDRLAATVARLQAAHAAAGPPDAARPQPDRIVVSERRGLRFVRTAEILLVRADGDYTHLQLRDGTTVTVKVALSAWAERLRASFVRAHRSILVSVADVTQLEKAEGSTYLVRLRGIEGPVPVSRAQVAALKRALARGH